MLGRTVTTLSTCLAILVGCGVSDPSPAEYVRIEPSWVSGSARADLGPDGRFRFLNPLPAAHDEISRDRALLLSAALMRTAAISVGNLREYLEEWHGGPINFNALKPCGPMIPKRGMFSPIPSVPRYIRTAFGNSYILDMCSQSGLRQVELEIFARTEMEIDGAGLIIWPAPFGTEYIPAGLPRVQTVDLSAEYGAKLVYQETGVRIDQVPELDGCLFAREVCIPHIGRHWRYHLENAIMVRVDGTGELITTRELYTQSGFGAYDHQRLYLPAVEQPKGQWIDYVASATQTAEIRDSVYLEVVRPIALRAVTVHRPNR